MNINFNCIFNSRTVMEAFFIGFITFIIGKTAFYFSVDEKDKKDKNENNINIILFVIGFLLHFIIEIIGINQWYCDKCIV